MNISDILSTLYEIIIYSGIAQGIYSTFILSRKKLRNPANHFLGILMIVLSFSILHSAIIIPYFHKFHNTIFHIREPFILLIVPLIWLYMKKLNEPVFVFKLKHIIHFLPFLVVMSFSILSVFHVSNLNNDLAKKHTLFFNIFLYIITLCQFAFYIIYIFRIIGILKNKAQSEFSNTENTDPTWMRIFLATLLLIFILLTLMMVIAIHNLSLDYFNRIVTILMTGIVYVLGYKGIFQQSIPALVSVAQHQEKQDNAKNVNEIRVDETQLKYLQDFMWDQKSYRDPELTLTSLAIQLNMSRNQLSELINSGTGKNFYEFINNYRVEDVKQLIADPKNKNFTILSLAFEAGFPSKSTFNSFFKKYTGTTPSEYRNRLISGKEVDY